MKKLILFELILLFLATTFDSDNQPGWVQQSIPIGNKTITDIQFLDSLNGWVVTNWNPSFDTSYIFKTSDAGNNWTFQSRIAASFTSICMVDYNVGYVVGGTGNGRVYKTTNGGVNWSLISVFASSFFDVQFVNKDTGWVCSQLSFGGLYKTTNGGLSWQQQLNDTYSPFKLFFINKDTGWVGSSDFKLYRTNNSGLNWNWQVTFPNPGVQSLFFLNKDTGWVIGGGGTNRTTDGGQNWVNIGLGGGFNIKFFNINIGFGGRVVNVISKTTNGGFNWFNQSSPISENSALCMIDTLTGWAGGSGIVHTTDGGGPPVGIKQNGNEIPSDYVLYQNYPNPFNPVTNIKYQITNNRNVKLTIFDVTGRYITDLVNQKQNAGAYEVQFDGSNFSSGIYFYCLIVEGNLIDTKRMLMIK